MKGKEAKPQSDLTGVRDRFPRRQWRPQKKKVFSHNFLKCFLPLPPALNVLFRYTGGIYRPFDSAFTNKAIDDSGSPKWANASEGKKNGRSVRFLCKKHEKE